MFSAVAGDVIKIFKESGREIGIDSGRKFPEKFEFETGGEIIVINVQLGNAIKKMLETKVMNKNIGELEIDFIINKTLEPKALGKPYLVDIGCMKIVDMNKAIQ